MIVDSRMDEELSNSVPDGSFILLVSQDESQDQQLSPGAQMRKTLTSLPALQVPARYVFVFFD